MVQDSLQHTNLKPMGNVTKPSNWAPVSNSSFTSFGDFMECSYIPSRTITWRTHTHKITLENGLKVFLFAWVFITKCHKLSDLEKKPLFLLWRLEVPRSRSQFSHEGSPPVCRYLPRAVSVHGLSRYMKWGRGMGTLSLPFLIRPLNPPRPSSVSSVAQSCQTLCDPMNHSTPGLPVHHQLPELTQIHVHRVRDAIQPSHPWSSLSPPAPSPSQHQRLFQWVNSSHEVAKVLEFQL